MYAQKFNKKKWKALKRNFIAMLCVSFIITVNKNRKAQRLN